MNINIIIIQRKIYSILLLGCIIFFLGCNQTGLNTIKLPSGKLKVLTYYDNGAIKTEGIFSKEGILNGDFNVFYSNGNLKALYNYTEGKKNGLAKYYYENGRVHISGLYKDDLKDSIWNWYYDTDSSILKNIESYRAGKLFGGQSKFDKSNQLSWYKLFSLEKEVGKIAKDSTSNRLKDFENLAFLYYNKDSFNIKEEFTSIVYIGSPFIEKSNLKVEVYNSDNSLVSQSEETSKRINNCDKYLFNFNFPDLGKYKVNFHVTIFDNDKTIIHSEVFHLDLEVKGS